MPTAPLQPCSVSPCPNLTTGGPCPDCAKAKDQRRGTAHHRGYTRAWIRFRPVFFQMLVDADILPVCGAALPTGPLTRDSACRDAGLFTFTSDDGSSLHLDHEPELQDHERQNQAAVCDPNRIVLKCASCHSRKTRGWGA